MLRGGNGVELGVGICEFYERMVGELAGEVWVDVLHRKMPCLRDFPVENTRGYHVNKSVILYDGRILGKSGNNDYFPGYISRLDTFRKVSSQDTHAYLLPIILSFYNNSNILFDIHPYHI